MRELGVFFVFRPPHSPKKKPQKKKKAVLLLTPVAGELGQLASAAPHLVTRGYGADSRWLTALVHQPSARGQVRGRQWGLQCAGQVATGATRRAGQSDVHVQPRAADAKEGRRQPGLHRLRHPPAYGGDSLSKKRDITQK